MPRSTRNKMRWQVEQILNKVEDCQTHLGYINVLSEGRSEIVNDFLPQYAELLRQVHALFVDFRTRL